MCGRAVFIFRYAWNLRPGDWEVHLPSRLFWSGFDIRLERLPYQRRRTYRGGGGGTLCKCSSLVHSPVRYRVVVQIMGSEVDTQIYLHPMDSIPNSTHFPSVLSATTKRKEEEKDLCGHLCQFAQFLLDRHHLPIHVVGFP